MFTTPIDAKVWIGWWLSSREGLLKQKTIKTQLRHLGRATEFSYVMQSPFRIASRAQRFLMSLYGGRGTLGAYYPLVNYVKYRVGISAGNEHLRVHELTHALGWLKRQETAIAKRFLRTKEWKSIAGRKFSLYWDNPWEIYSRLMQLRFEAKVSPDAHFTADDVAALRSGGMLSRFRLASYSDGFLLFLLNEVA